jgi:hypothetical protein
MPAALMDDPLLAQIKHVHMVMSELHRMAHRDRVP